MRTALPFPLCVDERPDPAAGPDSTEPSRRRRYMHLRREIWDVTKPKSSLDVKFGRYKAQMKSRARCRFETSGRSESGLTEL